MELLIFNINVSINTAVDVQLLRLLFQSAAICSQSRHQLCITPGGTQPAMDGPPGDDVLYRMVPDDEVVLIA